jgi:hypothetical protein
MKTYRMLHQEKIEIEPYPDNMSRERKFLPEQVMETSLSSPE